MISFRSSRRSRNGYARVRRSAADAVAASLFRAIERLVGTLQHVRRSLEPAPGLGGADADRDGDELVGTREVFSRAHVHAAALLAFLFSLRPVLATDRHLVELDRGTQRLEVAHHVGEVRAGEEHGELLAPVAERAPAAADFGEPRGDQL